ncbi:outer membrane protein assembly factor BamD [Rhodocytophaga aerolata]|uniref:Outer membrane protein assembly factor BamD n=1 Tax=Rhodocytophaga aerolata TaxID=455078 RepID=A0ABT8QZS5_9BACT|nr:outer membrane protein assembly factor BamD [Rhodocytophaga aerolata]MDO1445341.1 outer membrane protein assembly factor BamD [Rhodocytophaga aerolata]
MQNSKYLLFILFIAGVFFSSCSKFTKLQKSTNVEEKYQAAVNYYTKKDYNKASLLFEEIIPLIQGTPEAERAQFYLANAHFQQRDYILSAHYFKKFYETYSRSEFAEEAMYLYAYSLYEDSPSYNLDQTNTYTAIEAMQTFINAYPGSKYKEKCNEIIALLRAKLERKAYENAELYSHKEDYKAAVVAFENFQRSYPDSDYNERAAYLKLVNAYNLAKSSTEAKKRERYESTIEYYENFIDKYAKSRYLREAENIYEACVKIVGEAAGAELQSTKK